MERNATVTVDTFCWQHAKHGGGADAAVTAREVVHGWNAGSAMYMRMKGQVFMACIQEAARCTGARHEP